MKRWSPTLVVLMLGVLIGSVISQSFIHGDDPELAPPIPAVPAEQSSYRDLVKRVLPAVVSIEANGSRSEESRRFFQDNRQPAEREQLGFGSGVVVDPKGVILTNYHVVEGADQVIIETQDGRRLVSKNIKTDPKTDLAVVLVETDKPLAALSLGATNQMEIGDRVLAVGAPFGLVGSVTSGIISGKGRSLGKNLYEDYLQTDAAINPGNSGGPLINLQGQVVGINTAIKSRTGGFQGVGLAISSELIQKVLPKLLKDGKVSRGYLGAQVQNLPDRALAERLGLRKDETGVLITHIFSDGPAEKGGLREGDVIISLADKSILDSRALQLLIADLPLNQPLPLKLIRDAKLYSTTVTLKEQPTSYGTLKVPLPKAPEPEKITRTMKALGVEVMDLTPTLAENLGYAKETRGVLIADILPGDEVGRVLRPGSLITQIDRVKVSTVAELQEALSKASLQRGILVGTYSPRAGHNFHLVRDSD